MSNQHKGRPCKPSEYNDISHTYRLQPYGVIPSVTTICQPEIPPSVSLEEGATRGKYVHDIGAMLFGNLPTWECDPKYQGYYDAITGWWKEFTSRIEFEILHIEEPWVSPSGYGGTADLILRNVRTNEIHLKDVKTSKHALWHKEQTAGYALEYLDEPYKAIRSGVYLNPKGRIPWAEKHYDQLTDFVVFAQKASEVGVDI